MIDDPETTIRLFGEKLRETSQDSGLRDLQRLKSGLPIAGAKGSADIDPQQAKKAAQDFESYFLYYMLKGMRDAFTDGDPLMEGEGASSFSQNMYKDMLDEEFGKAMAQGGGIGMADMILKSMGIAPASPGTLAPQPGEQTLSAYARSPERNRAISPKVPNLKLARPVAGAVTSTFGQRIDPITNKPESHEGMDLRASVGQPVGAAASGIVIFSGVKPGYGKMVEILHADGFTTLYAHLSETPLQRGDFISRGGVIGLAGNSGRSTGPHLHLELRQNGTPINPEPYLVSA